MFTHLKKLFAEDGKAAEVIETAKKRLFGLRLEVVEAPLLKIEAAVDREGRVVAVRCRAALDVGVEAVFEGVAPGYRLEKTAQASKRVDVDKSAGAEAAENIKHRDAAGRSVVSAGNRRRGEEEGWVERLLEEVRREFSGLPVYVGVEEDYVKRTAPMDQRQFRRYLETCKRLGFRFDRWGERCVKPLEELQPSPAV